MGTSQALPPVLADASALPLHEPSVVDDGELRRLYFGPAYVQSEMSLAEPFALSLKYTQKMMAFLLFCAKPRHILIVGLGGGSLTKFCYHHLPKTRITTIEIDARVIALAPHFQVPAPDQRMQIIQADVCEWLRRPEQERFDVVLLDGYDESGIAGGFGDAAFYARLRARLRPGGLLVANILVPPEPFRRYKHVIHEAFDDHVLIQRVIPDGNQVVFAFTSLPEAPDWAAMLRDAKKLQQRLSLDFPAFARGMRRAWERKASDAPEAEEHLALL